MASADVLQLVAERAYTRAAMFRDRAAQLRAMAEDEPVKRVRDKLLDLADQ